MPRTYTDYREMLKEKDLDIVLIGTPDHWHALQMIAAVKPARMSTCQKPISVDVIEAKRWSPPRANTTASCRSARSARARRT